MEPSLKKTGRYLLAIIFAGAALTAGLWAQSGAPPSSATSKDDSSATHAAVTGADIQALRQGLAAAMEQIQQLKDELHRRDAAVQQAQTTATDAAAKADAAQQQAKQGLQNVDALQSDVAELKNVNLSGLNNATLRNAVMTMQEPTQAANQEPLQVFNKQMESPITIRFRGINITPGGYAEGAFVRRSRALGADLSTPFNNLTMPGASQSHTSELFGSGRQSKATVFVEGRVGHVDLSSYVSADFLSAGVTSTSTQTDGYTLRLRQAWGQVRFDNGWSFLGGQAWSLVTEDAVGISPDDDMGKTNDVRPKTIDPSYNVGFDFARQAGFRLTKSFKKVAFAVAIENPQATLTTHGNAAITSGSTTYYNFLLGQAGDGKSFNSLTTYGFNPAPDLIAKVAFDPGFGHYEIFGLVDRFTDRVFPCVEDYNTNTACNPTGSSSPVPNALFAHNVSKEGGGFGASARWRFFDKRITFGLKGFGGNGVGRYAPGSLPDISINPNGTLRLVKNLHGLGTLEWHGKKLDVFSYGGTEYAARTWSYDPTILSGATSPVGDVGYGAPAFNNSGCSTEQPPTSSAGFTSGGTGKCIGDTRALVEGTLGFWYRFYSGPRGRFQFGTQYSYVTRNAWSGTGGLAKGSGGLAPNGLDNMVFTSFRYYLP